MPYKDLSGTDDIVSVPERFMGNKWILDPLFGVNYGTIYKSGRGGRKTLPIGMQETALGLTNLTFTRNTWRLHNELN